MVPGDKAIFSITIENLADKAQSQSLEVLGLPATWYSLDFDASRLAFEGEQRTATLLVSVPPEAGGGQYTFQVEARSGDTSNVVDCALEVTTGLGAEGSSAPTEAAPAAGAPAVVSLNPALVVWRGDGQNAERVMLSVGNPGAEDEVYTVQVSGLEATWYSLVPGIRVAAGQMLETEMRLQPPASARLGDYPFRVTVAVDGRPELAATASGWLSVASRQAATTPAPAPPKETPTPAAAPNLPPLESLPELSLAPRTSFRFAQSDVSEHAILTVRNRGQVSERYQIGVDGIPEEWVGLAATDVRVEPGASSQVPLRITPHTSADWPAGEYEFRIRVTPAGSSGFYAEVGGLVSIAGVSSFDARLAPTQAEGTQSEFTMTLVNTGDLQLTLAVEPSDPEKMCRFKFAPPREIGPGQQAIVRMKVGARRNGILGASETFDFRTRVSPTGEQSSAKVLDARFVHKPMFGYRSLFLLFFLAAVIGLVALVLNFASPAVSSAATWIGCQLDGNYRLSTDALSIKKPECGGKSRAEDLLDWERSRPTSVSPQKPDSHSWRGPRARPKEREHRSGEVT